MDSSRYLVFGTWTLRILVDQLPTCVGLKQECCQELVGAVRALSLIRFATVEVTPKVLEECMED